MHSSENENTLPLTDQILHYHQRNKKKNKKKKKYFFLCFFLPLKNKTTTGFLFCFFSPELKKRLKIVIESEF